MREHETGDAPKEFERAFQKVARSRVMTKQASLVD